MNFKILLFYFTISIISSFCTQEKNNPTSTLASNDSLNIDTSRYVIFKKRDSPTLTNEDVQKIYLVLLKCVDCLNKTSQKHNKIDIRRYRFQISHINDPSNKNIFWLNSFCDKADPKWRKEIVSAKDGGICFFNLKIDLKKLIYFDLIINGEA